MGRGRGHRVRQRQGRRVRVASGQSDRHTGRVFRQGQRLGIGSWRADHGNRHRGGCAGGGAVAVSELEAVRTEVTRVGGVGQVGGRARERPVGRGRGHGIRQRQGGRVRVAARQGNHIVGRVLRERHRLGVSGWGANDSNRHCGGCAGGSAVAVGELERVRAEVARVGCVGQIRRGARERPVSRVRGDGIGQRQGRGVRVATREGNHIVGRVLRDRQRLGVGSWGADHGNRHRGGCAGGGAVGVGELERICAEVARVGSVGQVRRSARERPVGRARGDGIGQRQGRGVRVATREGNHIVGRVLRDRQRLGVGSWGADHGNRHRGGCAGGGAVGVGELERICAEVARVGSVGQVRRSARERPVGRARGHSVGQRQRRSVRVAARQCDGCRDILGNVHRLGVGGRCADHSN